MNGSTRPQPVPLADLLEEWTHAGLLTARQAAALRRHGDRAVLLPARIHTGARAAALESLGYFGGAVATAAAITLTADQWSDLGTGGRLTVLGLAWLGLLMAGRLVPTPVASTGAAARVRSVLWLASVLSAASFLAVSGDAVISLEGPDLGVFVGTGTSAYVAALHGWWRTALQQIVQVAALGALAAALVAQLTESETLPGLGPWGVGVAWATLGLMGRAHPERRALVCGATMAVLGAMTTATADAGMVLLVLTLAAIVGTAAIARDPVMLGVGAVGTVVNVPQAVARFFPGSIAVPVALMLVGLFVVALAVVAARRSERASDAHPPVPGPPLVRHDGRRSP